MNNRELLVRVASAVLGQRGYPDPDGTAEAIAAQMDIFAAVLRGQAPPVQAQTPPQRMAFPAPNPEAMAPVPPADAIHQDPGLFAQTHGVHTGEQFGVGGQPLIIPATTIPDKIEKVERPAEPLRSLRKPEGPAKMKVEQLNQMIQDNTPTDIPLEIPMEDGSHRRMWFRRDVRSMHGSDSVQICLYPANSTPSVREIAEVEAVVHIEDLPLDLAPIMERLKAQAVDAVRPKGQPREVPVRPFSGPVQHPEDSFEQPLNPGDIPLTKQTEAIFKSMG
jgi:hypothetical protein